MTENPLGYEKISKLLKDFEMCIRDSPNICSSETCPEGQEV